MKHNWEYKKLGEICESINGLWTGKNPPFVNIGVIRNTNFTKSCTLDTSNIFYTNVEKKAFNKRKLKLGDIIVEKSGGSEKQPVGRPVLFNLGGPFSFSNFTATLRLTDPNISSAFLHKVLSSFYFFGRTRKMQKRTTGLFNLNWKLYLNQLIPVPPREEQERIVAELDKINEVIEECRELLRTLDSLAQSIFYDTFGDPISNPKGWPIRQISEIGEIERGTGISKKDFVANGSPCIHYGQLHTAFGPTAHKHLTCIPKNLLSKPKIAHPRDVIMAITSEDVEGSCKSTAWLGDYDIIVGSDAAILHHNQNGVYISYYTLTSAFSHEKAKYAKGFKVTHISSKEIGSIPIMVPPLSLQQQFAAQIEAIEAQKNAVEATISEMKTLLDSRMDYWFND